jgi:ribonuclease VapC
MVIDTSALVAILQAEPERDQMLEALTKASRLLVSAVSVLETAMVIESRFGAEAGLDLELFLFEARLEIASFDSRQSGAALRAWRNYGKGRHPAQLNLGDCCVYGLAKASGEPILCKGNDFAQTDIAIVPLP